jgi:hypothetical protein
MTPTVFLETLALSVGLGAQAQKPVTAYPNMAPLEQYLMADRNAEIALARSAAPKAISDDAEVMVLEPNGYITAVKGTNGFVCMVQRSWMSPKEDPEFWNAKERSPICLNVQAARTFLPIIVARTKLVLAGKSKAEMFDSVSAALDKKELPAPEPGAIGYMMAKDGYLSDQGGHFHPHLMFFVSPVDAEKAGANLAGSPVLAFVDAEDRMTVFIIPVPRWSDGSVDSEGRH